MESTRAKVKSPYALLTRHEVADLAAYRNGFNIGNLTDDFEASKQAIPPPGSLRLPPSPQGGEGCRPVVFTLGSELCL